MFKIKRFRKIVVNYTNLYSDKPELLQRDIEYYISDLQNLIACIALHLEDAYSLLEKICILETSLSTKPSNIFWNFIQKIVDCFYDKVLYSIEELDSCRMHFVKFKLRAEQIRILVFHDKF